MVGVERVCVGEPSKHRSFLAHCPFDAYWLGVLACVFWPHFLEGGGHINIHIRTSMSRTSPFTYFGMHQQLLSTISTLVTILVVSFSESKARCKVGHDRKKKKTISGGSTFPSLLAFMQKRGQGQKNILFFAISFFGAHFWVRHEAND